MSTHQIILLSMGSFLITAIVFFYLGYKYRDSAVPLDIQEALSAHSEKTTSVFRQRYAPENQRQQELMGPKA